ncbi:MAG: cyclic pyranopterin monophosphate synthase MoaC, partial [Lachnospiraceae bacterium]|nr:cyclic pyranopterin monophosphate synthase MoaC [Lachnospiraceae bacterium]
MAEFTHLDENGKAVMVDVTDKDVTERIAVAEGRIVVGEEVFRAIYEGTAPKGDVLACARVAG